LRLRPKAVLDAVTNRVVRNSKFLGQNAEGSWTEIEVMAWHWQ